MFELTPFTRNSLSDYNPFGELADFAGFFPSRRSFEGFKTDIKDNGSEYIVEAELPGFSRENISVDIDGGYMTISAKRSSESENTNESRIHSERFYGTFTRSFDVSGVKDDEISAKYTDGVLKLTLPKKDEYRTASRRLTIQ